MEKETHNRLTEQKLAAAQ